MYEKLMSNLFAWKIHLGFLQKWDMMPIFGLGKAGVFPAEVLTDKHQAVRAMPGTGGYVVEGRECKSEMLQTDINVQLYLDLDSQRCNQQNWR
jgi:hypothetical protein